jgi:hypothetical protein
MASKKAIGLRLKSDGSRCAMGAAELAVGIETDNSRLAEKHWPFLDALNVHPFTGKQRTVATIVVSLNNGVCVFDKVYFEPWSREAIADWVETIEPQEVPVATKIEDVVHV